jgi:hypothetical protein
MADPALFRQLCEDLEGEGGLLMAEVARPALPVKDFEDYLLELLQDV